jgi:hypothetical protein
LTDFPHRKGKMSAVDRNHGGRRQVYTIAFLNKVASKSQLVEFRVSDMSVNFASNPRCCVHSREHTTKIQLHTLSHQTAITWSTRALTRIINKNSNQSPDWSALEIATDDQNGLVCPEVGETPKGYLTSKLLGILLSETTAQVCWISAEKLACVIREMPNGSLSVPFLSLHGFTYLEHIARQILRYPISAHMHTYNGGTIPSLPCWKNVLTPYATNLRRP